MSASLSSLAIGTLKLMPAFKPEILQYTATTSNATNKVTAVKAKASSTMAITLNGTAIENESQATWQTGDNTVNITVKNGTTRQVYKVTVTKS